ncbi:hypothetical protein [Neorhodopirellula lusitana]
MNKLVSLDRKEDEQTSNGIDLVAIIRDVCERVQEGVQNPDGDC